MSATKSDAQASGSEQDSPDRLQPAPLVAAGAVVLRDTRGGPEVLVVHRPYRQDWSLPKGHVDPGEVPPQTAVREVWEETGVRVRLDTPLTTTSYQVDGTPKEVHWWRARPVEEPEDASPAPAGEPATTQEVDQVRWMAVEEATGLLTYESDRALVTEATGAAATTTFILLRHAKALSRTKWRRDDRRRPLTNMGGQQAEGLVPVLAAFGVTGLISSSATRCMDTLYPYARDTGLQITGVDELSEEGHRTHPQAAAKDVKKRVKRSRSKQIPTVVCGHRPVLPSLLEALGIADRPMEVCDLVVAAVAPDGTIRGVRHYSPVNA